MNPSLRLMVFSFSLVLFSILTSHAQEIGVEELSSKRGRVVLNGIWKFMPATGEAQDSPSSDWGTISVPGSWMRSGWSHGQGALPGVIEKGSADHWKSLGKELTRGWFEREFTIPAGWSGRQVVLDFRRVSTDAVVWVNGQKCGNVEWPYGEVDITSAAKIGEKNQLRVLVVATADAGDSLVLMGTAAGQMLKTKSTLQTAGIIGEVFLLGRPKQARVSDVFVQTSVRKKEVSLEVELENASAGEVSFIARMMDEKGKEEKKFETKQTVKAAPIQTVKLSWPWADARLWDADKPNLYTLKLEAKGAGFDDEYPQRFGFREFWIEGRRFLLNGTEFRLRPTLHSEVFSNAEIDGVVAGMKKVGFNISQQWPENHDKRGGPFGHREYWCERADEIGWPTIGVALNFSRAVYDSNYKIIWDEPGVKEAWQKKMIREMRRYRNFPSILIWGTTGNVFNQVADQDPRNIGVKGYLKTETATRKAGDEGLAMIKAVDPTRPVFTHAGNRVGDIFTLNHYLCMTPLQEREEWLSEWAKSGDTPYIGIEFGTPLHVTMNRGRNGFGEAVKSEPWLTEFCAIYFGKRAFTEEPREYRRAVKMKYEGENKWSNWQGAREMNFVSSFQELQALFIQATWRSWRAMGVTGGMVPWASEQQLFDGSKEIKNPTVEIPSSGQRANQSTEHKLKDLKFLQEEGGWTAGAGAKALIASNGPTLAWIAGPAETFTAKDHHFRAGQKISKQVVLINDHREAKDYSYQWSATLGGKEVGKGDGKGKIDSAKNQFFPFEIALPASIEGETSEGKITMTAEIGGTKHEDSFGFRVYGPPAPVKASVSIFDPEGKTTAWLKAVGVNAQPWDGKEVSGILIIGREAYSKSHRIPGDLEAVVKGGGRVMIMGQDPEWLRRSGGFRVSRMLSRRVFAVSENHPVTKGIAENELWDWTGESMLVDPCPRYEQNEYPTYGWRWGSRGTVSSAAIEKPHRGGWRPILECEFDLAYSPLMELDYGKGRVTYCGLDFEDHVEKDPSANRLARRVLDYVAQAPLSSRAAKVVYLGNETGEKFLKEISLNFTKESSLDGAQLAVIGNEASVGESELQAFAQAGGKVLVLGIPKAPESGTHFGATIAVEKNFWMPKAIVEAPETAGLSLSDLRIRSEMDFRLIKETGDPLADGLITVKRLGSGVILYTQINPTLLETDKNAWLRFTRWRHTRAISQMLANLGGSFRTDERIFKPQTLKVDLAGVWKAKITQTLPPSTDPKNPLEDPGMTEAAKALLGETASMEGFADFMAPMQHPGLKEPDGEAVFRKEIVLPSEWTGQMLELNLGALDDYDEVYWNGQKIGTTDKNTKNQWAFPRKYRVQGSMVKEGKNVIVIRLFDAYGGGGFNGKKEDLFLRVISGAKAPPSFYHPDYREEFETGDEPYRYYRW